MANFCYIAPTSMLELTQNLSGSKTHLVLAHLVDRDEKYANFYKELSAQNHFIMMDNSAYELKEPYHPDKLIALAEKCGANAIVLPDYPFQEAEITIAAAEQFAPIFKQAGYKTFFVPQSKTGDINDWIRAYKYASKNPLIDIIGMSILGIPNALANIAPSYARVVMTQLLIDRGCFAFDKHHHYLGLNAGPKLEIPSLLKMNALSTIDSSGPVWSAILGHEYSENTDSFQHTSKCLLPVNFDLRIKLDDALINRLRTNITLTNSLFVNKTNNVWYAQE